MSNTMKIRLLDTLTREYTDEHEIVLADDAGIDDALQAAEDYRDQQSKEKNASYLVGPVTWNAGNVDAVSHDVPEVGTPITDENRLA